MKNQNRKSRKRQKWLGITLCICLSLTGCGVQSQATADAAIAEAVYPQMAAYPDETAFMSKTGSFDDKGFSAAYDAWWESRQAQLHQSVDYDDSLAYFVAGTMPQFLANEDGENRIYSPINVYLALAMLSELTDGNSRQQILDVLGAAQIEDIRAQAAALWNANYCDDGAVTSILANSIWLNEAIAFRQETLEQLAQTYCASSYQGEMGSDVFNQIFHAWLNEQTGGQLQNQVDDLQLGKDTVMALASTIYFRAKWSNEFSKDTTAEGIFHGVDDDIRCDFMHQRSSRAYYWGTHFSAVAQPLQDSGDMWLILPDEGTAVEALLTEAETMQFLVSRDAWENTKCLMVNLAMPKFDVVSDLDLRQCLQTLGITDVWDSARADFSPLTEDAEDIFLSQASHAARVQVDEEGCTAAAYTVMATNGATMPPDETIDFVLDRPFLFAITGADGSLLFIGVVQQPA